MSNTTLLIVVLVAVAMVAVLLVAFFAYRRRRQRSQQERARQEYGPEYERLVEERGSEREAERELRERRERVEGEVRPLSEESLRGYEERWQRVEEILVERNFPTDSRQEATEGIGVMHPGVVEDFREAQRTYRGATGSEGGADLEEMRLAIQKYRSVYERLTER